MRVILILFIILFLAIPVNALDRCESLKRMVRLEHTKYFGLQYPYWYGIGQLKQESACRTTVTAFDAGQGVAQFMPKTEQYIESLMGEKLDPYNPQHAIRMQAFYMHRIHTKESWTDRLWVSYQIYNSGRTVLYNEFVRAGRILDWTKMKGACKRKVLVTPSGYVLDLCVSGYDYSKKIEKYGNQYRSCLDGMRYW